MKLFRINAVGDPYESDETIAVCTSIEKVESLGLTNVWKAVREYTEPLWEGCDTTDTYKDFECLITGKTLTKVNSLDRPSPYIEEIETDVLLRTN